MISCDDLVYVSGSLNKVALWKVSFAMGSGFPHIKLNLGESHFVFPCLISMSGFNDKVKSGYHLPTHGVDGQTEAAKMSRGINRLLC